MNKREKIEKYTIVLILLVYLLEILAQKDLSINL